MDTKLRSSGIEGFGDVDWGTHFCLFYETKEDLLKVLLGYFKAGLENHEFCLWVTPEPLSPKEAKQVMREAGLEIDRYLVEGQIEIVSYADRYLAGDYLDTQQVLRDWIHKHDQAIARGYVGLRCTGDTFWLEKHQWDSFAKYEAEIDRVVSPLQIIDLCTYPLEFYSARDILDVVSRHQFTVVKRNGGWEHLEGSKLKRAHDEIRQLNADLEGRVAERTAELAAANEQLRQEVTERKQAEESLHESEEKFSAAFRASPISLVIATLDGKYVEMNQAFCDLLGYSREELLGKTAVDIGIFNAETRQEWAKAVERAGGVLTNIEFNFRLRNGISRTTLFSVETIAFNGVPHRLTTILDISERKQAEEALRQSESNFRTLAEKSLEGIQLYQGGRSVYANAAMTALLGYTQEELGAMSVEEHIALVHPLDRAIVMERAGRRQAGQEMPASLEVRILTKAGATRWVEGFTNEIEYNGQPAIISTAIDITERKRAEQALKESERRYHTMVDQIPAIVYIDNFSKDSGVTIFVNPYIHTVLGFTPEEWIDGGYDLWSSCIHPEDRVQVLSEYQRCIQNGQPFDREYRVIARDGRLVWLHDHSTLWTDEEGHPLSMHGITHDITERKQAEEEIRRHAARMEALAEISKALAEVGLDVQAMFETIVQRTAEFIGDTCSIRLLSSDEQWLESVTFHNPNPEVKALMRLLHPITPTSANDSWLTPVLRTGQPLLIPIVTEEQLRQSVQPEYLPFFEQVGLHSLLIVPLRVKGRVIGTLGVSRDQPGNPYTLDDQVLLQDLADRASLKIQNAQLFKQVQGAHQRLQVLSSRLVEVQESERKHLAREIHDEFGQSLTALKMDLAWLHDHLPPRSKSLREKVDSALDLTNETIQMTQKLASQLRPGMLDDLGLAAALEWHVNEWIKRTRIKAKITLPDEEWQLNPSLDTALYRVCQEALTNVARHAGASKVEVSLAREGDEVVLTVSDNGRGMDAEKITAPESLGLLGMKERVEQIGGRLEVQSEVGKGSMVVARVPILQLPSYQLSYPAPKEHVQVKKSSKGKESRRRKS